ncbi:hypothetical protein ACFHW2_31325 [Actinomadura sp. LOL_016]|uniref:hypothetical protein n=1 Tax=unclassified Actinomadura TaxID=2626254 RepID=UPI003A7FC24C
MPAAANCRSSSSFSRSRASSSSAVRVRATLDVAPGGSRDAGMWTAGRLGPDLVLRQAAAVDWRPPA